MVLGFVPILIIVFASLPEQRVSFAGEGVLAAVSGKIVQTGSQTAVLYQTDDICTGCPLQLNRQIFIYRYQNLFFCFPPPFCSGYVGLLGNHSRNMGHLFGLLVNFSHPRLPVIMFSASATVQKTQGLNYAADSLLKCSTENVSFLT